MLPTPSRLRSLRGSRQAFSLAELLLAIGILAVLAVVASFGVSSITEKARGMECLMNLRALGAGIQRYTVEHQRLLPVRSKPEHSTTARQWHREVWPFVRDEGDARDWSRAREDAQRAGYKRWLFHCPGDRDPASATPGLSYAINENLTDGRVVRLDSKQVLLLELRDRYTATGSREQLELRLPNRHGGRNYLLFADYHVEALGPNEIPTLTGAPEVWQMPK